MMNVNVSAAGDAGSDWLTVCEFCVKEAGFSLLDDAAHTPGCPSCGASLQDRSLIMTLISTFSESGDLRVAKFVEEKRALGLKFGSIGKVFSQAKQMAALIDYPFREDLRDLSWNQPKSGRSLRIPLKDHLLDALIAGKGQSSDKVVQEALRVLRPGGLLIVPPDHSQPQLSQSCAQKLQAAGFFTHFWLPCAALGQPRQGAVLLAVVPRAAA